ncbi:MAG: EAL domain-containing protein, partial [Acidobacteriota bacterium]|nr:EAL domain-containing protein [Acidobacteriota bacterium]
IREMLAEYLGGRYSCETAGSAAEALDRLRSLPFQLVISDINMPGVSGIELVPRVQELSPDTAVIIMSGAQTVESAVEAMRVGAFDYFIKPFDLSLVEGAVRRALDHQRLAGAKRRYETYLEELIRERTAELDRVSYEDAVTGLPNRVLFEDRLEQALARARTRKGQVALLLLDLDCFKKVNESLGYEAGDRLLRGVAGRLRECLGEDVPVGRFGGDEFALLAPQVGGPRDAVSMVHRIREALGPSFHVDGHDLYARASIGVGLFPADGEDAQTLLRNAGAALTRACEGGGGRYEFYAAEMNAEALRRLALESSLPRALEREEFVVYYQPQYRLTEPGGAARIVGAEALVRWQHPELGLVPPAEFIPLAESTGLITPLGEWVLRTACAQNRAWQSAGHSGLRVAVNLSAQQLRQGQLLDTVACVLRETGLEAGCLELELTESMLLTDAERAVGLMGGLREMGVRISVDDFGTGYSNLSYLIDLPIDALKVDRAFVRDVTNNPKHAKLLKSIVTMAHDLGLKVKAEGVETESQRDMLCRLRCDEAQGYLFSRPVPADEFERLLRREGRASAAPRAAGVLV